jgi:hypothetical protein
MAGDLQAFVGVGHGDIIDQEGFRVTDR